MLNLYFTDNNLMDIYILIFNLAWMVWNTALAFVGVAIAWFIYKARSNRTKLLLIPAWLAFVPNTIYILTDIIHIPLQLQFFAGLSKTILAFQYLLFIPLGILTFYLSIRLFESGMRALYRRLSIAQVLSIEGVIILINFLIAFGVAMGRFQRTNSWEIVTNFSQVFQDVLRTATSLNTILFVILFGTFVNIVYFRMRKFATWYSLNR